jgi:hypothetical protein
MVNNSNIRLKATMMILGKRRENMKKMRRIMNSLTLSTQVGRELRLTKCKLQL